MGNKKETSSFRMSRRQAITAGATAAMVPVAGCSSGSDGGIIDYDIDAEGFGSTVLTVDVDGDIEKVVLLPEADDRSGLVSEDSDTVEFTIVSSPNVLGDDDEITPDDVTIRALPGEYTLVGQTADGTNVDEVGISLEHDITFTEGSPSFNNMGVDYTVENTGHYPFRPTSIAYSGDVINAADSQIEYDDIPFSSTDDGQGSFLWPGDTGRIPSFESIWGVHEDSDEFDEYPLPFDEELSYELDVSHYTVNDTSNISATYELTGGTNSIHGVVHPDEIASHTIE